jgi:hypothetical protein
MSVREPAKGEPWGRLHPAARAVLADAARLAGRGFT